MSIIKVDPYKQTCEKVSQREKGLFRYKKIDKFRLKHQSVSLGIYYTDKVTAKEYINSIDINNFFSSTEFFSIKGMDDIYKGYAFIIPYGINESVLGQSYAELLSIISFKFNLISTPGIAIKRHI